MMNDWKKSTLPSRWGWTFQRGVRNHFLRARRAQRKKKKPCYVQTHKRNGVLHAAAVVYLFSVRLRLLLSTLSCEDGFFVVFFPRMVLTGLGTQMSRRIFARARTVIGVVVYSKIIRTITVHRREEEHCLKMFMCFTMRSAYVEEGLLLLMCVLTYMY